MQTEPKRVHASINFGERGTIYGCGHTLDTLLYAHNLTTEESLFEWIGDREHEAIDQALEDYDWEAYTLRRLNDMPAKAMLAEILEKRIPVGVLAAAEIEASDYLPGDWLRFNDPAALARLTRDDKAAVSEAVKSEIGDWSGENIPRDLARWLTNTVKSYQDTACHEWLHGDRSSIGVLTQLERAMFGRYTKASIEWEQKTDTVHIDADSEEWREWLGYDLDERDPLPSPDKLAEEVKKYALRKAEAVATQKKRDQQWRVAESAERERARAERLEKEKEAAREQKRQRRQA